MVLMPCLLINALVKKKKNYPKLGVKTQESFATIISQH